MTLLFLHIISDCSENASTPNALCWCFKEIVLRIPFFSAYSMRLGVTPNTLFRVWRDCTPNAGVAQGPGILEKVPEEILALFPGDSRSFFSRKTYKIPELIFCVLRLKEGNVLNLVKIWPENSFFFDKKIQNQSILD